MKSTLMDRNPRRALLLLILVSIGVSASPCRAGSGFHTAVRRPASQETSFDGDASVRRMIGVATGLAVAAALAPVVKGLRLTHDLESAALVTFITCIAGGGLAGQFFPDLVRFAGRMKRSWMQEGPPPVLPASHEAPREIETPAWTAPGPGKLPEMPADPAAPDFDDLERIEHGSNPWR